MITTERKIELLTQFLNDLADKRIWEVIDWIEELQEGASEEINIPEWIKEHLNE